MRDDRWAEVDEGVAACALQVCAELLLEHPSCHVEEVDELVFDLLVLQVNVCFQDFVTEGKTQDARDLWWQA
jgi:hypothetical protein